VLLETGRLPDTERLLLLLLLLSLPLLLLLLRRRSVGTC